MGLIGGTWCSPPERWAWRIILIPHTIGSKLPSIVSNWAKTSLKSHPSTEIHPHGMDYPQVPFAVKNQINKENKHSVQKVKHMCVFSPKTTVVFMRYVKTYGLYFIVSWMLLISILRCFHFLSTFHPKRVGAENRADFLGKLVTLPPISTLPKGKK